MCNVSLMNKNAHISPLPVAGSKLASVYNRAGSNSSSQMMNRLTWNLRMWRSALHDWRSVGERCDANVSWLLL